MATKIAAKLGDYVVTESGFGADLGAEKFLDIKTRAGDFEPDAVVIVATIRALKMHGGLNKKDLQHEDLGALEKGMENLEKHLETIRQFNLPFIVAVNQFSSDTQAELDYLRKWCEAQGAPVSVIDVFTKGGEGGIDLAEKVVKVCESKSAHLTYTYDLSDSIEEKIQKIAGKVYGAAGVQFSTQAKKQLHQIKQLGYGQLPICMAKTQYSLSDDPSQLGRPRNFYITVREFRLSVGAGFIVALTGEVMTMPGLPKKPAALQMDVTEDGTIKGLF